jgi:tetratricopeptide (TPR) repeat protein
LVHEYFGRSAPGSFLDRHWLVIGLSELGRFTEAAEHEVEMIRLAEMTQRPFIVGQAHFASGELHLLKGDWGKARFLMERGIAAFRTGNVVLLLPLAVALFSWALAQLGAAPEALIRFQEGEQLLKRHEARGHISNRSWAYHGLGRASLLLGRLDDAQSLGDRAVGASPHQPGFAAYARHLLGDIATHPDGFDPESGEAHYRQALALAEPRGMRPLIAHCHLGLGKLYGRTGKREEAQEHLTTATTMYREMGMTYWLEQATQQFETT